MSSWRTMVGNRRGPLGRYGREGPIWFSLTTLIVFSKTFHSLMVLSEREKVSSCEMCGELRTHHSSTGGSVLRSVAGTTLSC